MKRNILTLLILLIIPHSIFAIDVIPMPMEYETYSLGSFTLNERTKVEVIEDELVEMARELAKGVKRSTGYDLLKKKRGKQYISLFTDTSLETDETYYINASNRQIEIYGGGKVGIYYALQTVSQLFPKSIYSDTITEDLNWTLPIMVVTDTPLKAERTLGVYTADGMPTLHEINKIIDCAASYKLNKINIYNCNLCNEEKNSIAEYAKRKYIKVIYKSSEPEAIQKIADSNTLKHIYYSQIKEVVVSTETTESINQKIIAATSESFWTMTALKDFKDFTSRLYTK